jgi:hypothetical protein
MMTTPKDKQHPQEDDPCDDWSNNPLPKPSNDITKRTIKRTTWWQ